MGSCLGHGKAGVRGKFHLFHHEELFIIIEDEELDLQYRPIHKKHLRKGGSYGNKILYKNLDLTQDFPNKISFHFFWVKMSPKNLPEIFRWSEMCSLDKILAQDFQMAAFTKILERRDKSVVPLLSTENCRILLFCPPVGYFFIYPPPGSRVRRLGWSQYMHECIGASQGYHGVYRAAQTVLSRSV